MKLADWDAAQSVTWENKMKLGFLAACTGASLSVTVNIPFVLSSFP